MSNKINALFLCTGNSARSMIAEALLRHHFANEFNAFSAGSKPAGAPKIEAIAVLETNGIDTSGLKSQSPEEVMSQEGAPEQIDVVLAVCDNANRDCPVWPVREGQKQPLRLDWTMPDPDAAVGEQARAEAFQEAFDVLDEKIRNWAPDFELP